MYDPKTDGMSRADTSFEGPTGSQLVGFIVLALVVGLVVYSMTRPKEPPKLVPDGQFGVLFEVGKPKVLLPGEEIPKDRNPTMYSFGPNSSSYTDDFVTGNWSKFLDYARKSMVVNLMSIIGDAVREKRIKHVRIPVTVEYVYPTDRAQLEEIALFAAGNDLEEAAVEKSVHDALRDFESKLAKTEDVTPLETAVKEHLTKFLKLEVRKVELGKVEIVYMDAQRERFEDRKQGK